MLDYNNTEILGRILPINMGTYKSSKIYNYLDVVQYNNISYISKIDNNSSTPTNLNYWMNLNSNIERFIPVLSETDGILICTPRNNN